VISSHILQDLEALCSAFLLLRWGRILRSQTMPILRSSAGRRRGHDLSLRIARETRPVFFRSRTSAGLRGRRRAGILDVRWRDPAQFYDHFHELCSPAACAFSKCAAPVRFSKMPSDPPPTDEPVSRRIFRPAVRSNWRNAAAGVFRLTFGRFRARSHWLPLSATRHSRPRRRRLGQWRPQLSFVSWITDFYITFLVPIVAFISRRRDSR